MKILGANNVPLPFGTAGGIHWINTVWQIAEAGATVDLLAGISPLSEADEDILAFYGLKPHPGLSIWLTRPWPIAYLNKSSTLRARAYFLELLRLIQMIRPAVIYGMGMPNHLWILRFIKKWVPFRVVLELHEDHSTRARRQVCVRITQGARPSLDGIVTTSPLHRKVLIEEGVPPHRVHTFPAAHRPDLVPREERNKLLAQLRLPIKPGDFVVFYGGNLYGDRGVEDLLQAFHRVAQQVPKAHLVVLGTGERETERLCRAIVKGDELSSRIHFTGRVKPTSVGCYLAVADIGVVPNPHRQQWEFGSPIKLSEYLGAGLAIVATSLRTTSELVAPTKAALLVAPESPKEMADAIIRLLTDESLRRTMQEKAFQVGTKLTYKARAESIYQFLGQLVEGREYDVAPNHRPNRL